MIPFLYKLREEATIVRRSDSCLVISDVPLNIIRVTERAARILELCDGTTSLERISCETDAGEEQAFRVCEYFRRRGILRIAFTEKGGYLPSVSVIIPTRDRREELQECLESVFSQDYPKDRFEVIVVDDGSQDGTGDFVRRLSCKLLSQEKSRGQSYCRNLGAKEARGEILGFIDSDCVAEKTWLKELVSFFRWDRVGAVGGFVDGYFGESTLDRYEKACSPLNMGKEILIGSHDDSTFYTPTCNLLVRRKVYIELGGITESLYVGEDVDFCWRLRGRGYNMLYVPAGAVLHKHRNDLIRMMRRRADYGTSEALLYSLHRGKRKVFQLLPVPAVSCIGICMALLFLSPAPLLFTVACLAFETAMKMRRINAMSVGVAPGKIACSVVRSHFSFFYFVSFHLVRYYLSFFLAAGILFHPLWYLALLMVLLGASVDYHLRRPKLLFPWFALYYAIEHVAYQIGVFAGCIRRKTFGSYLPKFVRATVRAPRYRQETAVPFRMLGAVKRIARQETESQAGES